MASTKQKAYTTKKSFETATEAMELREATLATRRRDLEALEKVQATRPLKPPKSRP